VVSVFEKILFIYLAFGAGFSMVVCMKNIMFDLAAQIVTDKDFSDIPMSELIAAMRKRLDSIEAEADSEREAFGFCDEYEVEQNKI
jgi:hypothetical protein